MADPDVRRQIEDADPLRGAEEHDAVGDAYWEASKQIEDSVGLTEADEEAMPDDEHAADDAMP